MCPSYTTISADRKDRKHPDSVFFLVPKPRLGNALAGEAPASRDRRRTEAGASGADAFPSRGLGTRKKKLDFGNALLYYAGEC